MRDNLYEIPKMSGVYALKSFANGKYYIGSTPNLYNKFEEYIKVLNNKKFRIDEVNEDIRKYGIDNFELDVVCTCTCKIRTIVEQYFIKKWHAITLGYNKINASNNFREDEHKMLGFTNRDYYIHLYMEKIILELFDYRNYKIYNVISIWDFISIFESQFNVKLENLMLIFEIIRKLDIDTYIKDLNKYSFYKISGNQMWKFIQWSDFNSDMIIDKKIKEYICNQNNLKYMFLEVPNYIGKKEINDKILIPYNIFISKHEIIDLTFKTQYKKIGLFEYGFNF